MAAVPAPCASVPLTTADVNSPAVPSDSSPTLPSSSLESGPARVAEERLLLNAAGYTLQARFTPPQGVPLAAILLIPGSLFVNVDGDFPAWNVFPHSQAHLARQLSERGFAVYRFSKAGPGTESVVADQVRVDAGRASFHTRVEVAQAAFEAMRERVASDSSLVRQDGSALPLLATGHSEGSVVATLLARGEPRLKGIVLLAGPSVGILEIMREQFPMMVPPNELEQGREVFDRVVEQIRRTGAIDEELRASPYARSLAQMDAPSLSYMRTCDAVDPAAELAHAAQPVLIVQGTRDHSVPEHHAHRLREARRANPALDTDLVVFTRLQHFFKQLPDGLSPMEAFGLPGDLDERVAAAIESWTRMVVLR